MNSEQISTSHIGYLCPARKVAVVREPGSKTFVVEHLAVINDAPLSASASTFKTVYRGDIEFVDTLLGTYGLCDFSSITSPGIYRVALPESGAFSYQFAIADGAYHHLPYLFLDYVHGVRSGYYSNDLRRALNVDDGVRSDTGKAWDATGGWYDAGDLRKWMTHSTLPALAFLEAAEHLRLNRHTFDQPETYPTDWLTETVWGLQFIFKMQDPQTGMFFEDVGGGSTARRREGMSWWYENHAGCYADNSDNRFTDNIRESGDERQIRVQYNPIAQYTNISILARSVEAYAPYNADISRQSHDAALAAWDFCGTRLEDTEHQWTSVRAWRLCAALEFYRVGLLHLDVVDSTLEALLDNFDDSLGFWVNAAGNAEPYRAILHAAQPLIALAKYLEFIPTGAHIERIHAVLTVCKQRYIDPMVQTNPYRFMPFGAFSKPATPDDVYRPWRENWVIRFCMPVHHPQQINHGLSGHWMSWAHGLAYVGQMLGDSGWTQLAWAQIEWLLGNNPDDVSVVSGVGYNNPMPHSIFLGTLIGGFMNGFRGTKQDIPFIMQGKNFEWNSNEYWNVPLSNCLMALARLLPATIQPLGKLG